MMTERTISSTRRPDMNGLFQLATEASQANRQLRRTARMISITDDSGVVAQESDAILNSVSNQETVIHFSAMNSLFGHTFESPSINNFTNQLGPNWFERRGV